MEEDTVAMFAQFKGENRLINDACLAAYKSFELVREELLHAYSHFSAKTTIKSLCKRVLASFDLLCNNLSIVAQLQQ